MKTPTESDPLRVVELFSGVGAQAMALRLQGIPHVIVGTSEIDRAAMQSYEAIHGPVTQLGDITALERLPPDLDLVTYSFPCQDLSVAGSMRGMEAGSGTRSSLIWEVGRLVRTAVEDGSPLDCLLMENVPAILNKLNIAAFREWIQFLADVGYTSEYAVLNAVDYDVPQNRKRCFMVSTRDGRRFRFPEGTPTSRRLRDVLEADVPESYYLSDDKIARYEEHRRRHDAAGHGLGWQPRTGDEVGRAVTNIPTRNSQNFVEVEGTIEEWRETHPDGATIDTVGNLHLNNVYEMASRVYGTDGVSPCITSRGDVSQGYKIRVDEDPSIAYPCATTRGWMDVHDGDGLVMARPFLARGTVQPQRSPTLTCGTGCDTGVVVADRDRSEDMPDVPDGGCVAVLTPGMMVKGGNGHRYKDDGASFTVTSSIQNGVATRESGRLRIRLLTPRECWRLMGFPDWAFDRAVEAGASKAQLYRQAGNSIVVPVLQAIFRAMYQDRTWGSRVRTLDDYGGERCGGRRPVPDRRGRPQNNLRRVRVLRRLGVLAAGVPDPGGGLPVPRAERRRGPRVLPARHARRAGAPDCRGRPAVRTEEVPAHRRGDVPLPAPSEARMRPLGGGAMEASSRPMSRWTKSAILGECRDAGVPESSLGVLGRMPLDEIRDTCLVMESVRVTGSETDPERRRHTCFWTVDLDFVRDLGRGCAVTEETVRRLTLGYTFGYLRGWEVTPEGHVLEIPGVGYARISGGDRTFALRTDAGVAEYRITGVDRRFGTVLETDVPGLSICIKPTGPGCER